MFRIARFAVLFCCAFASFTSQTLPALAQQIPDTPAGARLSEVIAAINSGNETQIEQLCRGAFAEKEEATIQRRIGLTRQLHQRMGKLSVVDVTPEANRIVATCETSKGPTIDLIVELEKDAPHHIQSLGIATFDAAAIGDDSPLDRAERDAVLEKLAEELEQGYVYPDKGKKLAARVRDKHAGGGYDELDSVFQFASRLTTDLREVCDDKHLAVRPGSPSRNPGDSTRRGIDNYGFVKIEILPSNIGYLKLNSFDPLPAAEEVAAAAMKFLENTHALIFDLRDNGGGSPKMIAFLSSYLFDEKVHLNSFYERPTDSTNETWTQETVPGRKFDKQLPVYVLTSRYTFSGAEEFSYNLKHLGRATIVGETTGGGAHPVTMVALGERMHAGIPFARAINPITKTNWEGVGVKPQVEVASDLALDKAVELAKAQLGTTEERVQRVPVRVRR